MRLAVLADIHSNLYALEAALERLGRERIDHYLCAGDLVGYGPHPNECVRVLRDLGATCVAGNHDLMAVNRLSLDGSSRLAQSTLGWTQQVLDDGARAFLEGLPAVQVMSTLVMAHGALNDPRAYVTRPEQAERELDVLAGDVPGADCLILGHTHQPLAYAPRLISMAPDADETVQLPRHGAILLNPGSVGQPRERAAVTRFLVLDLYRREASFRRIPLDVRRCRDALRDRGLPPQACHRPPSRLRAVISRLSRFLH